MEELPENIKLFLTRKLAKVLMYKNNIFVLLYADVKHP